MKTLLSLILLIAIFTFFLPNLLSTTSGNRLLTHLIEKKTGIQMESATLSWTGPQILKNLSYINGKKRVTLKEVSFHNNELILQAIDIWITGHHISGEQISLTIQGTYSIPFFSFSFEKINVPSLTLRLGKMNWQNFGAVRDLLSIIQLKIPQDANIPLWFQDTPSSITNGIVHFERTEFLLDKTYQFAVWNDLDLVKNEFNLVFGIPQKTIKKVLDIHNLPKNFVIPMRFTGPFNDPKLHKSTALKIMGTLLLLQKLPLAPVPKVRPSPPERPPFPWK